MDLGKTQHVLARLYTDAAFRERCLADPKAAGEQMGLSCEDAQQLAELSAAQVNFFAESLVRKRLKEVRRLLPRTHRLFGDRFDALFHRYARTSKLRDAKPHQQDALAFAAFLEHAVLPQSPDLRWAVELARYEAAWIEAADLACCWIVRRFRFPVSRLVQEPERQQGASLPAQRPTVAVWLRLTHKGRLRHFLLSFPFRFESVA